MKIKNIVICHSLILFAVLVSGCVPSIQNATTPPLAIPTLTASSATPTLTPLATDTSLPSQTPTTVPVLSVEEASKKLLDLLANNSGCRLPCLWGIAPGESTYQEAQAILMPLSSISELTGFRPGLGSISPVYSEDNLNLSVDAGFLSNSDQIVSHIAFRAEAHRPVKPGGYENVFDSKFFGDKVSRYMPPNVLFDQGVPSSVMIATYGGPLTRGGIGGFDILLLYPDLGILVNYTTQMYLIGTNVRGCPSNAHVEMELYPSGQSDSFFELLKQTDWAIKMSYYKPLEEVTTMSVNEFHQTFREPTDKCIETPADLWPIPEP